MNVSLIFLILVVLLVGYVISVYNSLVELRTRIRASIQEIGNQLKRQFDLIPNLEASAKAYLRHEKDILKLLADARKGVSEAVASGDLGQMGAASDIMSKLLSKIQVVVESNPQLKGADVITRLMDELRDTSDKVMYARRTLIDLTADYNVKLVAFPSNLVAQITGFQPEKGLDTPTTGSHLEVNSTETQSPKVKLS